MTRKTLDLIESRLAATIRDYMRARDAGDRIAVGFGAQHICHGLERLLSAHLEGAESWPSRERWTDGMVGAHVDVVAPDRLRVAGYMVWGLRSDPGGEQWAEPFQADVTIGWPTHDLRQYQVCFSDSHALAEKRVTPGLYAALAGPDDPANSAKLQGSLRFMPLLGESEQHAAFPDHPKDASSWKYRFTKE